MQKLLKSLASFVPYTLLIVFLAVISLAARFAFGQAPHLIDDADFQVFTLGSIFFIGYFINRIAPRTAVPSFVWAIFAGMAIQPLLAFFTRGIVSLKVVMEVFAAIVLFAGGLEVPFRNFQKYFFPIASLSFIGVVLTALMFSSALYLLSTVIGIFEISLLPSIIIVSAALASADPTAIIPTLKTLHFKRGFLKQVAISETALTDITGSILTRFLLLALVSVELTKQSNVVTYFVPLLQKSTYDALGLQIITGILIGSFGFYLIKQFYYRGKKEHGEEIDPALLLSIPIFTFVLGNILAGAGFLAAFVSGLLADVAGGIRKVSHFYDSLLNHLIKPFIFIILGSLVPLSTLVNLAPLGILAALVFMFFVRPTVVFISLLPWLIKGEFQLRDLLFLSFIRETGIIAAILIIIASSFEVIQSDFVIALGMWIILLTLIIEPPLTPYLAKLVGVADDKK